MANLYRDFTNRQKMAILDAKQATLAYLAASRTIGRMSLYTAVSDLYFLVAPMPAYATRRHLAELTARDKGVCRG